MSYLYGNYGLDFLTENEDTFMKFAAIIAHEGKCINNYYGTPYFYKLMGDIEFVASTEFDNEGNLSLYGIDIQSHGKCLWELVHSGLEISTKDSPKTKRTIMFDSKNGEGGFLPIEVITSDVLPSLSEGDTVLLQVVAQPIHINYYTDEEEYLSSTPRDELGPNLSLGDGALLAAGYINNHSVDNYEEGKEYETDNVVLFRATVSEVYAESFEFGNKKEHTFIKCVAETTFGRLEFDHTVVQVPEEQRKNIKSGSIIAGACVLSGDAAILDYNNGIIKDFEHNLQLCKYTFEKGEAERLRPILAENAIYESCNSDLDYIGPDNIINKLNYIHENTDINYKAYTATIVDSDNPDYPVGERCVLLLDGDTNKPLSFATIRINDNWLIEKIKIDEYELGFKADIPEQKKSILDDVSIPERVAESIMLRAEFRGVTDREKRDEILNDETDIESMKKNVKDVLSYLEENHSNDIVEALKNATGYLFAKAAEKEYYANIKSNDTVNYNIKDAVNGHISSSTRNNKIDLVKAMDFGKIFYADFLFHLQARSEGDERFNEFFEDTGITVQKIGKNCYAKFINL